jgi:hypothetical protein
MTNINKLVASLATDQVILNLTPKGLYQGSIGQSSADYYLENYVIYTLTATKALPTKDDITSSVNGVSFKTWCYPNDDGYLTYTTKAVDSQQYYQAYFEYDSSKVSSESSISSSSNETSSIISSSESGSDSSSSNSSVAPTNTKTYYFYDNSTWNTEAAYTYLYVWSSSNDTIINKAFPGEAMTWISYDNTNLTNFYSYNLDTTKGYDKAIFVRCKSKTDNTNWNQTSDIDLPTDTKNLATLSGSWGTFSVTWSTYIA